MPNKPTITQIAKLAGVSTATVSRYINNTAGVRSTTASAIFDAIKQLNYPLPNDVPINEESFKNHKQPSNIILINIPTASNPFYNQIIKGIQNSAQQRGYSTLINVQHLTESSEDLFFHTLEVTQFAGAIILNPLDIKFFNHLYERLLFVQCCETTPKQNLVSYVTIDNIGAAKKMTEYLISIRHKKIALLMGPNQYKFTRYRLKGYLEALKEACIESNPNWIISLPNLDFDTAFSSAKNLLSMKDRPSAIFAMSDIMAAASIKACHLKGLRVPEDIAVAGFDNIPYSKMYSPSITTISQPTYNLGYMACDLLFEKIAHPDSPPRKFLLNTELIIRESTQPSVLTR